MSTLLVDVNNDLDKEQIIARISLLEGVNKVTIIEDDWENWTDWDETNYLCSIPGMKEKIIKGLNTPSKECVPLEEVWPDV